VITKIESEIPTQFLTKVVGVSFSSNYPENIFAIAEQVAMGTAICELVREPKNIHDKNSIRVDVNGVAIGHLPRLIAMILAPNIDSGHKWLSDIHSIVISNENMNQPGLKINVWREQNATL